MRSSTSSCRRNDDRSTYPVSYTHLDVYKRQTSCYVGDNTDIILMRDALKLVRRKVLCVIESLSRFAAEYKDMPALAYTHLQPAQLTTVGKRATLWIHDLLIDIEELDHRIASLKLLGNKGTTGTQASFLELFEGCLLYTSPHLSVDRSSVSL